MMYYINCNDILYKKREVTSILSYMYSYANSYIKHKKRITHNVAVNHTLIWPWAMLIYSSLENISKCIISQNLENLDPAEGVCMYCLTDQVSGFACGDHADC